MAGPTPPRSPRTTQDREHERVMRDLRQQGQAAATWGLPNPATEAAVLGMGLIMRDRLTGRDDGRAADAAALAARMLDKTIQKMPQAASVQCARGCNFCCHSAVSVSAPEVFRITRLIASTAVPRAGLDSAAVVARAQARTGPVLEAVLSRRAPCPLLIEGECGVYEDRPMGCRQFISTNMDGCRSAFERGSGELPFVPAAANAGLIVRSLLLGAAASIGLQAESYELSSALAVALAQPDAEQRWLAGEDVLAGALKVPHAPNLQSSMQRWSGMLEQLFE